MDYRSFKETITTLREEADQLAKADPLFTRLAEFLAHPYGEGRTGAHLYPGLESKPFWDPRSFPLIETVESRFAAVRESLLALRGKRAFSEYREPAESPYGEKFYAGNWNTFNFYYVGMTFEENLRRCPAVAELLQAVPGNYPIPGHAHFSAVTPNTHISPHRGTGNYRLRCQLGLITNDRCEIRVGEEIRQWKEGQCVVIDDSFEHEVWNRGSSTRFVLLLDIWHPDLRPEETQLLTRFFTAFDEVGLVRSWKETMQSLKPTEPDEVWWV